jgi:ABC transport system ATP-binding/permease protein
LHEEMAVHATNHETVTALDAQLRMVRAERDAAEQAWLELADSLGAE